MAAPPRVPLLLAVPGEARGGPRLFQAALDALRGAPAPVHVVAVFGPRGSGKSFLLDQLAGPGGGNDPKTSPKIFFYLPPNFSDPYKIFLTPSPIFLAPPPSVPQQPRAVAALLLAPDAAGPRAGAAGRRRLPRAGGRGGG